MKLFLRDIDAFVFDFDGVLTDNTVYLDENGKESVRCNRGDGLGFNILEKMGVKSYIISSEKNKVVSERASKLNVPLLYGGIANKSKILYDLSVRDGLDLSRVFYTGNDVNDFQAMKICGFSACPADSHPEIKKISKIVLNTSGGDGVVRELLEEVFCIDIVSILGDVVNVPP